LNSNSSTFPSNGEEDIPSFVISAALLNDALFNITMSAISATDLGRQSTLVTQSIYHNIFTFSSKPQFFLPYLLCLVLALPFIILGLLALHWNGVSAMDGSFLQILCTTTESERLRNFARDGCLGGEENLPQDILGVKIKFGELLDDRSGRPTGVAGFGIEDQVVPLVKGKYYGGK
jgi:hypothetical protein